MAIKVNGTITNDDDAPIYRDWFGQTVVSPADVINELPEDGSDVVVEIASNGGEVDPATAMCTALRQYSGNVTVQIVANAYSAGTIVAMGADKVQMAPGAKMMIHNASGGADGNYHDMEHASNMLQVTNKAIANMYAAKTGKPAQDWLDLMDQEKWIDANEAIELGLADEIQDFAPVTNSVGSLNASYQSVQKIKALVAENTKLKQTQNRQPSAHEKLVQAKLAIFNGGM
ncbi:head maturation protease, ClpP-related [Furfurilactobacillus entadae]|uniref:head maturation protease, ClpP-related n=1 Tax=Furfurilactobacillus entadae TaxID=2922307 RepID=UPI0035E7B5F6